MPAAVATKKPNIFDQFDPPAKKPNVFDQFDPPANSRTPNPYDQFDPPANDKQVSPDNPYLKFVQPENQVLPDNPYLKFVQPNPPEPPQRFDGTDPRNDFLDLNLPAGAGGNGNFFDRFDQPGPQPAPSGSGALYVVQQADRGIADAAGAPVDLTALALNLGLTGADKLSQLLGGPNIDFRITKPVGGSDWIAEQGAKPYVNAGGTIVQPEDVSQRDRLFGEGARFGTAAMAGGTTLASKPVQMAAQSDSALGRIIASLAKPYENSNRAIVGDTVAGAGAGTGQQTYQEYAPNDVKNFFGPFGPIAAAIAGGMGGAGIQGLLEGGAGLAGNAARRIVRGPGDPHAPLHADSGKPYSKSEMDQAARAVQAQASNPQTAAANIADNLNSLADSIGPGQAPTSGAISGDPGLALLEREARARNPKPFAERDRSVNARAGEIVQGVAPKGSNGRDFTDAANALQKDRVAGASQALDQAQANERALQEQLRQEAAPVAKEAGKGAQASQALDQELTSKSLLPMQERKNAAFAAVDPNRTVVRDATPLIQAAADVRSSLGRLNDPSSVLPTATINRIEALAKKTKTDTTATGLLDQSGRPISKEVTTTSGGDGTITYGELNALRPELGAALTKARAAGDFPLADNIRTLQVAINKETERLASEATPAGQRAAEAQRIYNQEFAPVWNVGPGDEATRFRRDVNADRTGRTMSPPSATAGRFMRPGQPEKVQSLVRILTSLPDQTEALNKARDFLVSDLAESGVIDPVHHQLRPDALRRWRNQWGDVLNAVPTAKSEVDGLLKSAEVGAMKADALSQDVRRASARLDDLKQNKGALGLVLGKDPINAVTSVFNDGDPERAMSSIVREVGNNKRAMDGLKSSVVEYLTNRASQAAVQKTADGSRPIDFGKLDNLFSRHEKTLTKVFSPEEMNSLRQAHKLLRPQQNIKQSGGVTTFHTSQKRDQAWTLLEGGLKARYGVIKGGGILRTIKIFVSTLPNRDKAVQDIVLQMHFDPTLAQHLLGRNVDPQSPQWNAKLNRMLAVATSERGDSSGNDGTSR